MKKFVYKDYEYTIEKIVGVLDGKLVVAESYENTSSSMSIKVDIGDEIVKGRCSWDGASNWHEAIEAYAAINKLVEEELTLSYRDWDKIPDVSDMDPEEYFQLIVDKAIEAAMETIATIVTPAKGEVAGHTASGEIVYRHPQGHSHRPDLDAEAIASIVIPEGTTFHRQSVDMGRIIGVDHLVETTEEDEIVFLKRGNRSGESRMVLNRKPKETSKVFVVLCKNNDEADSLFGNWCLVTLFEGEPGLPEPWSRGGNTEEAKAFWETHALVPTDEEWAAIKGNA